MKIFGIIIEANPFHNGHLYFINQIKKKFDPDVLIAVTSASVTMRGEISIINKFDKVNYLLDSGIDIVLELPSILALQSSSYFAENAICILNSIGVNNIVCGCEIDDFRLLTDYDSLINSEKFLKLFSQNKNNYYSLKKEISNILKSFNIDENLINLYNKPNFTLAASYYQAIKEYPNMRLSLIKRTNDYYESNSLNEIAPASSIRNDIVKNIDVSRQVPFNENFINLVNANKLIFTNLKFNLCLNKNNSFPDKEGIINYMSKNISNYNSYDEFINSLANKRYSKSRIRRNIFYYLLDFKKLSHKVEYLRILGLNKNGENYIHTLNKDTKNKIFSSPNELKINSEIKEINDYELKTTKLFSLISSEITINEFTLPIRKKE